MSARIEITRYADDGSFVINTFNSESGGSSSMGLSRREARVLSTMLRALTNDKAEGNAQIIWDSDPEVPSSDEVPGVSALLDMEHGA